MSATLNAQVRQLQKVRAVLVACHCAIEEGAEFDVADVIAVAVALLDESLAGLDRLEVSDA